jgi:hypothetical protein
MSPVFLRPGIAEQMAQQLLHPGPLDEAFRSGLFISGVRRTGKTTFLRHDLIPALEAHGALVIYVDLWSDTQTNPSRLVHTAVKDALAELQKPHSRFLQKLARVRGADVGAMGFKLGFKLDSIGEEGGPTLAQAFLEVVDQTESDVVLIVDEVQHAMTTEEGNQMLFALKAARDAVNQRPHTPGHFVFIGTGSHRAMVQELTTRRTQAFAGAVSVVYPVLDESYVQYLLQRMTSDGIPNVPDLDIASSAFRTLGNRPEEFLRALRLQLTRCASTGESPNVVLPIVSETLRTAAAEVELTRVEEMGGLAKAIFEKIAATKGEAKGIFSASAAAEYSKAIGREVKIEEIQPAANELLAANIIIRLGHGIYSISDPFVQEIWRERKAMLDVWAG